MLARELWPSSAKKRTDRRRNNGSVVRATNRGYGKISGNKDDLARIRWGKKRRLGKKKKKKGKLGEIESVPNCGAFHTKRLLALIVKEVVRQGCTRW